jgi:DNA-binding Lrp family transcriptional regulator
MAHLDKIDLEILTILQSAGRVTNRELAERVGLSAAPCWHRVKRLEQTGVIDHYACVLSDSVLGWHVKAIVSVTLVTHSAQAREVFETAIADIAEVRSCFWVAGDFDYQLIITSTDLQGFEHFLDKRLLTLPSVASVKSQMALKTVKNTTAIPLDGVGDTATEILRAYQPNIRA